MAECNSIERSSTGCNSIDCNIYPNLNAPLNDPQKFRLNKINEIKDYFVAEIKERQLMSKSLSKYIASSNYSHKTLHFICNNW